MQHKLRSKCFFYFLSSSSDIRTNPELHFFIESYCNVSNVLSVLSERTVMSSLSPSQTSVEEITCYLLTYIIIIYTFMLKTLKLHRLNDEPTLQVI